MGVPKFFRFISERYPLVNTSFPAHPPQVDNLYLDMNGIVHNCVRSSPGNGGLDTKRYSQTPSAPRRPNDIYLDVFKYIDNLLTRLTPTKLLYLAVDGVAPRAKMNQQRSRRFRSAQERADEHQRLTKEDPMYAASGAEPFDSNCITPGTIFMHRLTQALRYYVARKVTEDPSWASFQVVLSGPEVPGEGEHKIMEYIRAMRESGSFPPNTRHCVYGLDADLIMLGIITHEPHFFILREKVDFNAWRRKNGSGPRVATSFDLTKFGQFELLSIGVLREYISFELGADGNDSLPFFDLERLMDDFVFILMLIGNDFLPNLPTLDIADGTLSVMLHLYKRLFPYLGGYLVNAGKISPIRFEYFLSKLSLLEEDVMRHRKEQASSGERKRRGARALSLTPSDLDDVFSLYKPDNTTALPRPLSDLEMRREIESLSAIQQQHTTLVELKNAYYDDKFGRDFRSKDGVGMLIKDYVEGISWTLKYYTEGCRRWRWFFPHHYAPLASDVKSIREILHSWENNIVPDEPFKPWQQLLSVLPPASAWCLPQAYQSLMISPKSPIRDHYPTDFKTDLNGKRNEWEAVVLLPFVSEQRLMEAVSSIPVSSISVNEKLCNKLGEPILYTFSQETNQAVSSPFGNRLPPFNSRAKSEPLVLPSIPEGIAFSPVLLKGTLNPIASESLQDLPTLSAMMFECELNRVGVNVFGTPSRSESLLLDMRMGNSQPESKESGDSKSPVKILEEEEGLSVGSPIWFGFPWRKAGIIDGLADKSVTCVMKVRYGDTSRESKGQPSSGTVSRPTVGTDFDHNMKVLLTSHIVKYAISLGDPPLVISVRLDDDEIAALPDGENDAVHLQPREFVRRREVSGLSSRVSDGGAIVKGQDLLYIGHGAYFGHKCTVVSTAGGGSSIRVRFSKSVNAAREPPFGYRVVTTAGSSQRWMTLSKLSSEVGLMPGVVDSFLGSFRVRLESEKDEVDLGLGVKYIARALYVPGYAKRDDNMYFMFSDKCRALLREYKRTFPKLFENVERMKREDGRGGSRVKGGSVYEARDLFPGVKNVDDGLKGVAGWVSLQDVGSQPLVSAHAEVLAGEVVKELERHCKIILALQNEYEGECKSWSDGGKHVRDVQRAIVLTGRESVEWKGGKKGDFGGALYYAPVGKEGTGLRLGDRVVNRVGSGSGVPFGLRGTVVGLHAEQGGGNGGEKGMIVEVVFDEGFIGGGTLGGRCSDGRGKAVLAQTLFIVRPDRDNEFYMKRYARVAAKVGGGERSEEEREEEKRKKEMMEAARDKFEKAVKGKNEEKEVAKTEKAEEKAEKAEGAEGKAPAGICRAMPIPQMLPKWVRSEAGGEAMAAEQGNGRGDEAAKVEELLKAALGIGADGREEVEEERRHGGVAGAAGAAGAAGGEDDEYIALWKSLQKAAAAERKRT